MEEISPRMLPRPLRHYSSEDSERPPSRHQQVRTPGSRGRTQQHLASGSVSDTGRPRPRQMSRPLREDRGVGSGHDTDVTQRSSRSVNSMRLRKLQDEVDRLRDSIQKKTDVPPPAPPPAPQQQGPEYYDPFDDPYGFMRMPRRRANSFSGAPVRDWDEWYWTLPQNRQSDGTEIPLGYAAADAYASAPPPPRIPDATVQAPAGMSAQDRTLRHRMERERGSREARRRESARRQRAERGYDSDQTHAAHHQHPGSSAEAVPGAGAGATAAPGLYEYYVPSRTAPLTMRQQLASRGYFTTPTGGKIYASPNSAYYTPQAAVPPPTEGNPAGAYYVADAQGPPQEPQQVGPWSYYSYPSGAREGRPRVFSLPRQSRRPRVEIRRPLSQEDLRGGVQGSRTSSCPVCGSVSYHTHADYYFDPDEYEEEPVSTRRSRRSRARRRRSGAALRSYNPERRGLSRYWVREISELSSPDSDDDIVWRRRLRSRSLSDVRSSSLSPRNRRGGRRYRRSRSASYSDGEWDSDITGDLEESINLSREIKVISKDMINSVRKELEKSKKKKDFGSSYW